MSKVKVKVVSVFGSLHLEVGEQSVELSIAQAEELAELLQEAAEHAKQMEGE